MSSHPRRFAPALAGLALFGLTLASCGDGDPTGTDPSDDPDVISREIDSGGGTVESADGNLTLTIPPGALSGTETITIETLDPDDPPAPFEEARDVAAAYDLRPDGLSFDEPVSVTYRTRADPLAEEGTLSMPIALMASDGESGEPEALNELVNDVDPSTGRTRVTGTLDHFSTAVTYENAGILLRITGIPESLPRNETFIAEIVINATAEDRGLEEIDEIGWIDLGDRPIELLSDPQLVTFTNDDNVHTAVMEYGCEGTGVGTFEVQLALSGEYADPEPFTLGPVYLEPPTVEITCTEATEPAPDITGFSGVPIGPTDVEFDLEVNFFGPTEGFEAEIDFGDGTSAIMEDFERDGDRHTATTTHSYPEVGEYSPEVTVTNLETGVSDTGILEIEEVTVLVQKSGSGTGTVTMRSPGIVEDLVSICGPECDERSLTLQSVGVSDGGASVDLSAEGEPPATFEGWGGDIPPHCEGSTAPCNLSLPSDRTVTATFEAPESFTVDAQKVCVPGSETASGEPRVQIYWTAEFLQHSDGSFFVDVTEPDGSLTSLQSPITGTEDYESFDEEGVSIATLPLPDGPAGIYDWGATAVDGSGEAIPPVDGFTGSFELTQSGVENCEDAQ